MSPPARTTPRRSTPGPKVTHRRARRERRDFMAIPSYTHLQPARKCTRGIANSGESGVTVGEVESPVVARPRPQSNMIQHALTRIRLHLRQLHPLSTCVVNPGATFILGIKAIYNPYRPLNPFIPWRKASFFPLMAVIRRRLCAFCPTFQIIIGSLTHLQSLTGTYKLVPKATHALTPLFKGVSARGGNFHDQRANA
jgi:hypothetical protein